MATLNEKLLTLFEVADQLNEQLWEQGTDPVQMSVADLAKAVTARYGVTISFKLVDIETTHLLGHVERYADGKEARIYIVKNISPRLKRVVGTKELCQLALDTRDDWQKDGQDTLGRLVGRVLEYDAPENVAVRSEELAEVLAWELLYPHELRKKDLARLRANEIQLADLSARYGIPNHVIEDVLSAAYLQWCDRWWARLAAHRAARTAHKHKAAE